MTLKRRALPLFVWSGLMILLLLFPEESAAGAVKGARIAWSGALPALFPALVLSRLLAGSLPAGGKALPLVLGLTCGFPVGAETTAALVESGRITKREGNRLLFCCCNTGPAFLVGYCGRALGSRRAGWALYAAEIAAALLAFVLLIRPGKIRQARLPAPPSLHEAVGGAAASFLSIGGCIVFFSFLSSLFLRALPAMPLSCSAGLRLFLEITGGVSSLSALPPGTAFSLCAAGVGWAGLSVYLQSMPAIRRAGLDHRWYLAGRVFFAAALYLLSLTVKKVL